MLKKSKLYLLLAIIVSPVALSLFGATPVLGAEMDARTGSITVKETNSITCSGTEASFWGTKNTTFTPLALDQESIRGDGNTTLNSVEAASMMRDTAGSDNVLIYYCHRPASLNSIDPETNRGRGMIEFVWFDIKDDPTETLNDVLDFFTKWEDGDVDKSRVVAWDTCRLVDEGGAGWDLDAPITFCNTDEDGRPVDVIIDEDRLSEGMGVDVYEGTPSGCKIKGVGWLICPASMFLAEMTDAAYAALDNTFLRLEPIALPGSSASDDRMQLYDSWKVMRDIANIVFVIGFLIIVFSQLTSFGISNYGVKQLLPKIVIAAILVNISYFVCAISVDISNILGNSLRGLLMPEGGASMMFEFEYEDEGGNITLFNGAGFTAISGLILGSAIAAGLIMYFLPILLPLVVTAAVAVVTVIVVLTIRQALVVMLIVISPLAFVALLLPNTESYFQKWRSLFTTMLLVYPIISVIFGASALASRILMSTNDFPTQMIGAAVAVVPLALTPIVMKASGGLLNRWVGVANDPTKGWVDDKRNALKDKGDIIRAGRDARGIERTGGFVSSGGNRVTRAALGGANSHRRRALSFFSSYGDRVRKDQLEAGQSDIEGAYLQTEGGRAARNTAANAKIGVQNAQLHADTVRLEGAEGLQLEKESKEAETGKQIAEARAQTAAIRALPTELAVRAGTSAQDLANAKASDKQAFEELAAAGGSNPALLAAHGVGADTADAAQRASFMGKAINSATSTAQSEGESNYADSIETESNVPIGPTPYLDAASGNVNRTRGRSRAVSRAISVRDKAREEAVNDEMRTMQELDSSALDAIRYDPTQTVERRMAATGMRAKTGGAVDIMETFTSLGTSLQSALSVPAGTPGREEEIQAIRLMQQQFMADAGNKLSESVRGISKGQMARGEFTGSFADEILETFDAGGYSGENIASLHPKEIEKIFTTLNSRRGSLDAAQLANLKTSIGDFLLNAPALGKDPTSERKEFMNDIHSL